MKSLLRIYIYQLLALWIATLVFSNSFQIDSPVPNLFIGTIVLAALNLIIKPILKLLFFPINALTLGLFSLLINAGVFYLFYRLTDFVVIQPWKFSGFSWQDINLPTFNFGFWETLFIISIVISFIVNFLAYLSK